MIRLVSIAEPLQSWNADGTIKSSRSGIGNEENVHKIDQLIYFLPEWKTLPKISTGEISF